jgi:predicted RNA-binding Zn-ribbon protein involved in translation (DUF1610 family)
MIRRLKRVLAVGERTSFRECRHCGTNLDVVTAGCPTCGSTEVATYEV